MTIWAAHQMFLEDEIGSVEVGKYADLAVWDRDLYTVPTAQLKAWLATLSNDNAQGEYYLTDVIARAVQDGVRVVGVENTATARAAAASLKNVTMTHVKTGGELFELLATQAATALYCASLHLRCERAESRAA